MAPGPPLELGQPAGQPARAGAGSVLRRPVSRDVRGWRGVAIGNPPRAGGCQWTRTMGARRQPWLRVHGAPAARAGPRPGCVRWQAAIIRPACPSPASRQQAAGAQGATVATLNSCAAVQNVAPMLSHAPMQERSEFTCRLVARMARIHLANRRDWHRWDWRQRDGPCMTRIRLANGHDSQRIHISAGLSYTCRTKANRHGPRWKLSWFVCLLVCALPAVSCALRCPAWTRRNTYRTGTRWGYGQGTRRAQALRAVRSTGRLG
jgi:hypothetical protein